MHISIYKIETTSPDTVTNYYARVEETLLFTSAGDLRCCSQDFTPLGRCPKDKKTQSHIHNWEAKAIDDIEQETEPTNPSIHPTKVSSYSDIN